MNYGPAVLMAALACVAVNTTAHTQFFKQEYIPSQMPPPVRSQPQTALHLPPVEYDHPYKGKLTFEKVTPNALVARCAAANARSLACAFPGKDSCLILIVEDALITAVGWTKEILLRHEIAHCNGWPGDHPGLRPYQ